MAFLFFHLLSVFHVGTFLNLDGIDIAIRSFNIDKLTNRILIRHSYIFQNSNLSYLNSYLLNLMFISTNKRINILFNIHIWYLLHNKRHTLLKIIHNIKYQLLISFRHVLINDLSSSTLVLKLKFTWKKTTSAFFQQKAQWMFFLSHFLISTRYREENRCFPLNGSIRNEVW